MKITVNSTTDVAERSRNWTQKLYFRYSPNIIHRTSPIFGTFTRLLQPQTYKLEMPAAKTKPTTTNGAAAKGKASKPPSSTSAPIPAASSNDTSAGASAPPSGSAKPDKSAYDAEQEKIKADIEALQAKLVSSQFPFFWLGAQRLQGAVKDKISLTSKSGPGNDQRTVLLSELDSIREQQSGKKNSRAKALEKLKAIQDGIQKKVCTFSFFLSFISFPSEKPLLMSLCH
jgi:hypothetical protein